MEERTYSFYGKYEQKQECLGTGGVTANIKSVSLAHALYALVTGEKEDDPDEGVVYMEHNLETEDTEPEEITELKGLNKMFMAEVSGDAQAQTFVHQIDKLFGLHMIVSTLVLGEAIPRPTFTLSLGMAQEIYELLRHAQGYLTGEHYEKLTTVLDLVPADKQPGV